MTTDQQVDKAIALVHKADDLCREALQLLGVANYARLAAEDIVDAQCHLMDAVTHMQSRPWRITKKKVAKKKTGKKS
jgi:hypothetical protein